MPTVDNIAIGIARVYAAALLDSAVDEAERDALLHEIKDLLDYVRKNPDFRVFFSSPAVDNDARRAVLEKLFRGRLSDRLLNTLQVMNDKGRIGLFPQMYEEYRLGLEKRRGEVDVRVITAVPFPARLRSQLEKVLAALSGRRPCVIEEIDESALGGMIVHIEDEKFDVSVRHRLKQLRDGLADRASREIHSQKSYFEDVRT